MALADPRPFAPEFEQQDYPKIIYKEPQTKVDHNPDLALVLGENYFVANNAEEEKSPPWGAKAASTKAPGWDKKEA